MSKKITWKEKPAFQWFCWWILISSIVNVVIIALLIWKNSDFQIPKNFDGTIATILSVLGVFIAFTAINIYSVFNARVVDETQRLEKVKQECYETIEKSEKEINQKLQRTDDYNVMNDIYDIGKSGVLLEKVRAIYTLTERIKKLKRSIDETDSIKEKEKLDEHLSLLKIRIKQNLDPHYEKIEEIKNKTFRDIFNDFRALLDEETVV